jgi:hypothetical protein
MRTVTPALILAAVVGAAVPSSTSALPLAPASGGAALVTQINESTPIVQVRNGGAVAAGVIGGLIVGGIIGSHARPYYYGYPPPYYAYPPYYPYPAYGPYAYDPGIAYCMRRFRSYDPYSMTYVGRDGRRRSCP